MTIPKLYAYKDVAILFNRHPRTIANWARRLPKFKLGNTVRLPEAAVDQLYQAHFNTRTPVKRTRRPGIPPRPDTGTARKAA